MNLFTKQKQTHRLENKLMFTRGDIREEVNQEINIYTLLCIKYINNKDLLNSTRNYIQYLEINYNAKESEKEYIYT